MPDDLIVDRWPHRDVAAGPPSSRRPASPRRPRRPARPPVPPGPRRLAWPLLLLLTGAGLGALYFFQSRTAPFNSDGAANVLQGQAIATGNPLLRGWWTSDVSFYTTELPLYALVTAIRGLSPDVVHLCGAITDTLTVLLAALVARGAGAQPEAGGELRAGFGAGPGAGSYGAAIAAGITLAPSILGGTEVFLQNPDHAGTAVPVLLLLLLLGLPAPRRGRWLYPAGACALLALALAGDGLTLVTATVPVAVVSALRLAAACWPRAAGRRAAAPAAAGPRAARSRGPAPAGVAPLPGVLLDGALLAAAVASVGLARLLDRAVRALGGFDVRPLGGVALAPLSQVPANARLLGRSLILLFGANNPGTPRQAQTISAHGLLVGIAGLHVIGLLLAGAGLAAGIAAIVSRRADRVTQVLVAAIAAVLAAGSGTTVLRSLSNAHEVAVLLPLGAALAGRTLPGAFRLTVTRLRPAPGAARSQSAPGAARSRPAAGEPASPPPRARRRRPGIMVLALGTWLALNVAELGYAAAWPAVPPPQQAVAAWLVAHHERAGLAGYWQAASTTVTSGGRVLVAAITLGPASGGAQPGASRPAAGGPATEGPATGRPGIGRPVTVQATADRWESSADWYQPARHDATFVIAAAGPAAAGGGLPEAGVRARFGRPAAQYRVGQEVIMVYGYNLLTRVGGTGFPGPG